MVRGDMGGCRVSMSGRPSAACMAATRARPCCLRWPRGRRKCRQGQMVTELSCRRTAGSNVALRVFTATACSIVFMVPRSEPFTGSR